MTEKSYARQDIERDMEALDNPQHSDIRDLLTELDVMTAERDAWKREAETAIDELNRIAGMLPDSNLDIVHRVQAELATLDALRDKHANALLELRGLRRMIHGDAKPLEMLETLRDGPLTSWRIDGLHWFAKLDGVGADSKTFVGSGDTRDEAVENARTYAERYLARVAGALDFPTLTPDDVASAHARMFGTLRDIKPGRYTTPSGARFEVPGRTPLENPPGTGDDWTAVCAGCVGVHGELHVPGVCLRDCRHPTTTEEIEDGEPIRRCDTCGVEVPDATPAPDVLAALLAQKPERVGPSQYECADCHEPLTGLGAKVHECRKSCPGCTDPAGLAYHDPKLCGLEWRERWCRRCQRDTDEPEIDEAIGICQECLLETDHCLRCGQHRSRCEHGREAPTPPKPCAGWRCTNQASPGNPLCYECRAEANGS